MKALKVIKDKWREVAIVFLLLSVVFNIPGISLADMMHIQPMSSVQVVRSVTLVVAASDATALEKLQADYVCNGTDDHIQIQAALDAGGKTALSQGTFNVENSINLDSNQTLSGCGHNTILTTTTEDDEDMIIITATGSGGSEKTGIIIRDLQVDCNDKGAICIKFEYVDYSLIQNVYAKSSNYDLGGAGIYLVYSDFNIIAANLARDNPYDGILLFSSDNNTINSNVCQGNWAGIAVASSSNNVVIENISQGNTGYGIALETGSTKNTVLGNDCSNIGGSQGYGIAISDSSDNNLVEGNTVQKCDKDGIYLNGVNHNAILGNNCLENSQDTTNTYSNICLTDSDYNLIQGNICRAGGETNKPRYGINIYDTDCNENKVINNDLYDGFGTGQLNDSGTDTTIVYPVAVDDTPVDGATTAPVSSNWAFVHDANGSAHQSNIITITYIIDGGGSVVTIGEKGYLEIPFACTITGWTLLADQSGSIVIDVWNDTYANFPPTVADTITGSEKPTLSAAQENQDLALDTWTTAVSLGDILAFNVDSASTVERITLSIRATKT